MMIELNNTLQNYHFTKSYEKDNFDCLISAIYTQKLLQSMGYDTAILAANTGSGGHMWVAVRASDGWIEIETTRSYNTTIGVVLDPKKLKPWRTLAIMTSDPIDLAEVEGSDADRKSVSMYEFDINDGIIEKEV